MPIFVGHNSNRIVNESMAQMENSEGTRVGRMTRFASFRTRITAHKIENPDVGSPLWKFLEDNDSSKAAWWWSILSICVIAINSVSFVVESQPNFCCGNYTLIWDIINWVCLGFFTIEYGLRFYSCPLSYGLTGPRMREAAVYDQMKETGKYKSAIFWQFLVRSRIRFFLNFQNLIDITAILPFYVQLMLTNPGPGLRFIRVIRIVRIFRLLKIGKYSKGLKLLMNTMKKSMKALSSLALVMILLVVIMSTIIWMLERGVWCDESNNYCSGSGVDEEGNFTAGWYYYVGAFQGSTYSEGCSTAPYCRQPSKFTSIFPSTYWTLTTITTTGYGDMYPHTPTGKVLGCIVMLAGLLLLALPVTVISGNFATEYASEELIRLVKEEKKQKQLEEIQRWEQEFDHSMSQAPASFARGNRMLSMPVTPTSNTASFVSPSNGTHNEDESAEENLGENHHSNGRAPIKSLSMPTDLILSAPSPELYVIGKRFGDESDPQGASLLPPPPPRVRLGSVDFSDQINELMRQHLNLLMAELEDLLVEKTKDIVSAVLEEEAKAEP